MSFLLQPGAVRGTPVDPAAATGSITALDYTRLINTAGSPATGSIDIVNADNIGRKSEWTLTLLTNTGLTGTAPEGTITIDDNSALAPSRYPVATITIDDNTLLTAGMLLISSYTGTLTEGSDWNIGATDALTATSIASAVNTRLGFSAAVAVGNVVTTTWNVFGFGPWSWNTDQPPGISFVDTDNGFLQQISSPFFGINEGTDWNIGANAGLTAISIANAINTAMGFSAATPTSNVVNCVHNNPSVNANWDMAATDGSGFTFANTVLDVMPLEFDLGNVYFWTAGSDFSVGATLTDTRDNIQAAMASGLAANWDVTAVSTDKVRITNKLYGSTVAEAGYNLAVDYGDGSFASVAQDAAGSGEIAATGTVEVVDFAAIAAIGSYAFKAITVSDWTNVAGEVVQFAAIGGNNYSVQEGVDWNASVDNDTTAASLASALQAIVPAAIATVSVVGAVVTITAYLKLAQANSQQIILTGGGGLTITGGANFAGGVDGVILNVQVGGPEQCVEGATGDVTGYGWDIFYTWLAATSNDASATSLKAAMDGMTGGAWTNSLSAPVITMTDNVPGAAGNASTMSVDNDTGNGLLLSGANFTGGLDPGLTIVVGDQTYNFGAEFTPANTADANAMATSLAAAITGTLPTGLASAVASTHFVNLTSDVGAAGNSIGLSTSKVQGATVSGATLTGGVDPSAGPDVGKKITLNSVDLVYGTDIDISGLSSNNMLATNIASAINLASLGVTASPSSAVVSLTADVAGASGNSIGLSTDAPLTADVSGANLSGGVDGTLGFQGMIMFDDDFLYISVLPSTPDTSNWKKSALT